MRVCVLRVFPDVITRPIDTTAGARWGMRKIGIGTRREGCITFSARSVTSRLLAPPSTIFTSAFVYAALRSYDCDSRDVAA